jgi:hypothetical protein
MQRLRGTGKTFSTSGEKWLPYHYNPVRASKAARLHRLHRKGLTIPTDKASLRAAADQAAADHPEMIRRR